MLRGKLKSLKDKFYGNVEPKAKKVEKKEKKEEVKKESNKESKKSKNK